MLNVVIQGIGNVGWFLTSLLVRKPLVGAVYIDCRDDQRLDLLHMDIASCDAKGTEKLHKASDDAYRDSDIVVLCRGNRPVGGADCSQNWFQNRRELIGTAERLRSAMGIIIVVTSPVDLMTEHLWRESRIDSNRIMGFGGDLDRQRLKFILIRRGIADEDAFIVGEHGPRGIPAYANEKEYSSVAVEFASASRRLLETFSPFRNLATSLRLCDIIHGLCKGTVESVVSGLDPDLGLFITWPRTITRFGFCGKRDVPLGENAAAALKRLVERRRELAVDNGGLSRCDG